LPPSSASDTTPASGTPPSHRRRSPHQKEAGIQREKSERLDAVLFFTGGDLEMDAQQKADFLSFFPSFTTTAKDSSASIARP
jgi:hypothetical protein